LPESEIFLRARAEEKARGVATSGGAKAKAFLVSAKDALVHYWARCIYAVVLMSFFNFFS
jgi:SHS family lactate transporter-like MFS transporter